MNAHDSDQTRVVHLYSRDAVSDYDPAPFPMSCFAVRGKAEHGFNLGCERIRFEDSESEAVAVRRPRSDIPELGKILRCIEKLCALFPQKIGAPSENGVFRTIRLNQPQENVGVQKVGAPDIRHARHRSFHARMSRNEGGKHWGI